MNFNRYHTLTTGILDCDGKRSAGEVAHASCVRVRGASLLPVRNTKQGCFVNPQPGMAAPQKRFGHESESNSTETETRRAMVGPLRSRNRRDVSVVAIAKPFPSGSGRS